MVGNVASLSLRNSTRIVVCVVVRYADLCDRVGFSWSHHLTIVSLCSTLPTLACAASSTGRPSLLQEPTLWRHLRAPPFFYKAFLFCIQKFAIRQNVIVRMDITRAGETPLAWAARNGHEEV